MKESLTKIEKIVEKEIEAYKALEDFIDAKTQVLVKSDIEALEDLDNKIIEKTTSVAMLARARQQECINVGRIDLTFSEIVARAIEVDDVLADRLDEKKQILEGIVGNIQRKNNINAKLIDNSLFIMNRTIDFILKMVAPELDSYNSNGRMNKLNDNYRLSSIEEEV